LLVNAIILKYYFEAEIIQTSRAVGSRDLFNAAFVSCWTELSEMQQDELIQSIEQALAIQDIPEITQTLLNLAEFMEHCEKVYKDVLAFLY